MKEDNILSRDELEQLCRLYFDGMLTRREESDLARVLSATKYRSGLIDETVFMLGIERTGRNVVDKQDIEKENSGVNFYPGLGWQKSLRRIISISGVAACLMLVVSFAWNMVAGSDSDNHSEEYAVYINGEKVKDEAEAKRFALSRYKESMAFLAEMKKMESERMRELDETRKNYDSYVRIAEESMKENNIK